MLGENGVLLFPTFAVPAFRRYELLWNTSSLHYPMIVNVLGFPATHVPAGLNGSGLPVGFQVGASVPCAVSPIPYSTLSDATLRCAAPSVPRRWRVRATGSSLLAPPATRSRRPFRSVVAYSYQVSVTCCR